MTAGMLIAAPAASAGTYPMYQCGTNTPSVAPGWSVYGINTQASTVLSNGCSAGGTIGDYVFSNGQAGAVTENGSSGSQVGLALNVPASAPDVTIQSLSAEAIASPVTGDDAYLGFSSAGQQLPGMVELPYGASDDYTANESWRLPGGARDFEAFVNCTTDDSSPTCNFADNVRVPALRNVLLTLADAVPPTVTSVSGPLATAAAAGATVSGTQSLSFSASDADSGVRSATLTLTPSGGSAPNVQTIDYGAQCAYDSWNACPLTQSGSAFTVDTSALSSGEYSVELTVADAAGNVVHDQLGSIIPAAAFDHLLGTSAKWSLSLRASPRRVHRHSVITLAGRVATAPRPPSGKLIYLEARAVSITWKGRGRARHRVRDYGTWITFQTLRAQSDGAFRSTYRFHLGGRHRYQFMAVAPQEGGYANATGSSDAVMVTET